MNLANPLKRVIGCSISSFCLKKNLQGLNYIMKYLNIYWTIFCSRILSSVRIYMTYKLEVAPAYVHESLNGDERFARSFSFSGVQKSCSQL